MTPGHVSITSDHVTSLESGADSERPVRVRENFGFDAFHMGGYPGAYGFGPHGYRHMPWWSATGTPQDRKGGRDLPLFWNEIDLRGFRLVARDLDHKNQFAIGFLNLLTSYHVHKGYGWQACLRGADKTPYPTAGTTDPVVKNAQRVLDAWRDRNQWGLVSQEAFRRWRRDGEVFGRFFFGGWDRLPAFRFIDPERVGSPTGDTDTPDSFGIRTDSDDVQEIIAYHVWKSSDFHEGEWLDADRVIHAKANVDSGIKRGVTDFLPLAEQFDGVRRLLRNMLDSTITNAGVAWIEKYPTATLAQLEGMRPSVPERPLAPGTTGNPYPTAYGYYGGYRGYGYEPPWSADMKLRVEGNREFLPTPGGPGVPNYVQALQASLRGCGTRWGMPEFMSGDASNNNFASALIANSPFVRLVECEQFKWGVQWERPVALKVLELAVEAGMLSREEFRRLDVEVTEPEVASAEPDKDASVNQIYHAMGVKSATQIQLELGLDPQHEQANFDAEKKRGMVPGDEPPPSDGAGGRGGGGNNPLASLFGEAKDASGHEHDSAGRFGSGSGGTGRHKDGTTKRENPHPKARAAYRAAREYLAANGSANPDELVEVMYDAGIPRAKGEALIDSFFNGGLVEPVPEGGDALRLHAHHDKSAAGLKAAQNYLAEYGEASPAELVEHLRDQGVGRHAARRVLQDLHHSGALVKDGGAFKLPPNTEAREDRGPPPFPGAVLDKSKHRWVNPNKGNGGDEGTDSATPAQAAAQRHAAELEQQGERAPPSLVSRVGAWFANKYQGLVDEHGPTGAKLILAATVLMIPIPVPGTVALPGVVAKVVAKLRGKKKEADEQEVATPSLDTVIAEARRLLAELYAAEGEQVPELDESKLRALFEKTAESKDASGHEHDKQGRFGSGSGGAPAAPHQKARAALDAMGLDHSHLSDGQAAKLHDQIAALHAKAGKTETPTTAAPADTVAALQAHLERSKSEPEAVARQADAIVADLQDNHTPEEILAVANAVSGGSASKATPANVRAALKKIHNDLTAVARALDSQKV